MGVRKKEWKMISILLMALLVGGFTVYRVTKELWHAIPDTNADFEILDFESERTPAIAAVDSEIAWSTSDSGRRDYTLASDTPA
jgi:hypothetical protein